MVQINFNANEVQPSTGFEPLPEGEYLAIIESSEEKATKAGTGAYLQFTFQVIEGEYAKRKVWARLNHKNPSAEAQKIGLAELSALCRAVGVMTPQSTEELHNKPLRIKVGFEKRADNGELSNKIKKYAPADAVAAGAPIAGAVVDGSSKKAAATPPWAAKK